jgi:hypothetical protein
MCGAKLTPAQRHDLLTHYIAKGFYASIPLAESLGVSPRYLAKLARRHGHFDNYTKRDYTKGDLSTKAPKRTFVPRPPKQIRIPKTSDRRWRWAIERGAVTA